MKINFEHQFQAIEAGLKVSSQIRATHLSLERRNPMRQFEFLQMCLSLSHREWEAISTLRDMQEIAPESPPVQNLHSLPADTAVEVVTAQHEAGKEKRSVRELVIAYLAQEDPKTIGKEIKVKDMANWIGTLRPELNHPRSAADAVISNEPMFIRVKPGYVAYSPAYLEKLKEQRAKEQENFWEGVYKAVQD